jgi:peptidoglycan hydrolase CwlO-like protein
VALGKKMLASLLELINRDIDEKIEIEIGNIDATIKNVEIEKERRGREIEILNKKLAIINQRKKDLVEEIKGTKEKIQELENQ